MSLMAVMQHNKRKVFLVMDYHKLSKHVDAFTANADVCLAKLQEWHQQGVNVVILAKSVTSSTQSLVTVDILNCHDQGEVVLPYAVGIQPPHGTSSLEVHY